MCDISLRPSCYTFMRALCFQNVRAHWRAGRIEGNSCMHKVIAIAECIPLIGQALAVIEVIVWKTWTWVISLGQRDVQSLIPLNEGDAVFLNVPSIRTNYTQTQPIASQRQAHEAAKIWLTTHLAEIGAQVTFISPPPNPLQSPKLREVNMTELLDPATFCWFNTQGVAEDIQRDGIRLEEDLEIVYVAASQYNGCEAPGRYTVLPGQAMAVYVNDHTQGPQAQLQFGRQQVELINAGAGNLGFNSLVHVLDDTTKGAVQHGYLTPISRTIDQVTEQLLVEGHKMEYLCVKNKPTQGTKDIHQILAAAPAFGMYNIDPTLSPEKADELQYVAALLAYRAQFAHAVSLARTTGNGVILKPTAVGLGVFENKPEIIAKAFYVAAHEVQTLLQASHVRVELQVFRGAGKGRQMADHLHLQEKRP